MSLCCCSTAAGRGVLLPSLLLGRRHLPRHPLLNLRTTTTVASSSSAAATTSSLSPPQQRQVTVYVDTLLEWNQRMNLTAVTDEAEVMTRHVADSLAMLPPLERAYHARSTSAGGAIDGVRLIDVGSGAGLPGLILAVARPSWKVTLLELMRKRCTFLEHAVEAMELSNVDVVCDRAELNQWDLMVNEQLLYTSKNMPLQKNTRAFQVLLLRCHYEKRVIVVVVVVDFFHQLKTIFVA
ncbi:uncharacterized protein [Miscanthus floridulus]|uniref:uncharacterized protein isoform X1 n=1 Tax=Miscanthus floridulus TaxID=154761 RepID=UPI00345A658E